jgi:CRISPR system Cascade subunit CasE
MFLSQLILNPRSREAQRDIANPYDMHRTLTTRCFAEGSVVAQRNTPRAEANAASDAHGLLFRLDADPRTNQLVLLAQSRVRPEWSGLPGDYAVAVNGPKDFDLSDALASGRRYRFRLRASPTKRLGKSWQFKQDVGKRVPIKTEDEQMKWLYRKAEQHGFKIVRVQIGEKDLQFGRKAGNAMRWHSVCFDGVLEVTNPAALRIAVESGIGTAKGMGFGLLSLAPVPLFS